jgi:hypothetical protein
MTSQAKKSWWTHIKDYDVSVQQLPSGEWLGSMGLSTMLDSAGTSVKQEVFPDVISALRYVGYPVDFVPIPESLQGD